MLTPVSIVPETADDACQCCCVPVEAILTALADSVWLQAFCCKS